MQVNKRREQKKNIRTDVPTPGLFGVTLKCEGLISCIGHVMNIHSDASYLSKPSARSRACGHFFMGEVPIDGKPIKLNDAFYTALFLNCQEGMIFKLILEDLGHKQPKIPVHCDNATAVGITNNTIKRQ